MIDPRKAKTLGEASQNPDGTYSAIKALSWLSDVLNPGKGIPEEEVRKIADEVIAKRDCQHDWLPGAEGAFAGLTEHCSKCGLER